MKWEQDLIRDIRTHSSYDDIDNPPWGLCAIELSDCNLEAISQRFGQVKDKCRAILEIGVNNNGDRSVTNLLLNQKNDSTIYVGIDIKDKSYLNNPDKNVYTIMADSADYLNNLEKIKSFGVKEFDFIFLDGWHSINHMLADWEYTSLLSDFGIVGLHDVRIHPGPSYFIKSLNTDHWDVEENVCRYHEDWGVGFARKKPFFRNQKVGIVLTGISKGKSIAGRNLEKDWKLSKESIKNNIIDPFSKYNKVEVYLTTYNHPELSELIDYYKPKKTIILPLDNSHQRLTLLKSMQELQEEELDFIINTRFDVNFNLPLSLNQFNFDKFNFLFREVEPHWSNSRFVSDNFFSFPKKYLPLVLESIKNEHINPYRPYPDMHAMYVRVGSKIKEENCHFIFPGCHNSAYNSLYSIPRSE